jgi:very-short-patch-repair endonuclease
MTPLHNPPKSATMIVRRQYRSGYQVTGLVELARELRKKQTSAEGLLWQLLRNRQLLEFKFRRQHQIGDYVADFYCHEAQLVIERDGSVHESNEQWYHDRNRDAYMIAQGLRVLRLTNDRILNDTENVLEEIAKYLPSPSDRRAEEEESSRGGATQALSPTLCQREREKTTRPGSHSRWIKTFSIC